MRDRFEDFCGEKQHRSFTLAANPMGFSFFFFLRDNFLFDLEHLQGSGLPQ